MATGVSGCMKNEREANRKKEAARQYLNEKYGEEFCILSMAGSDILTEYDTFRAVAVGADEKEDWFTVKMYENEKEEQYQDDYFGILIREDMENTVSMLEEFQRLQVKVYIKRFFFPGTFNTLAAVDSLDDAKAADADLDADYYIFIMYDTGSPTEFYEMTEQIFAKMAAICQPGFVRIYGLSETAFSEINRKNCETLLQDYYHADHEQCFALARKVVKNE